MADPKAPVAAPKAPTTPAPAPTTPPAPEAAAKPKNKRTEWKEIFDTQELAIKEAESRDHGPRRVFTATVNGKTFNIVAGNFEHACRIAYLAIGGTADALGAPKTTKPVGVDGILAALSSLSEEDRKKVEALMAGLKK